MDIGITVNRKSKVVPPGTTLQNLLISEGYESRVAVWINGTQLLIGEYASRELKDSDTIKILRLAAGG